MIEHRAHVIDGVFRDAENVRLALAQISRVPRWSA